MGDQARASAPTGGPWLLGWLRAWPLRTQVVVLLASVVLVSASTGSVLVSASAHVVLTDERIPDDAARVVARILDGTVAVVVLTVLLTSLGAVLLLRSWLHDRIDELQVATERIAGGRFSHRIESPRRDELGALATSIDGAAARLEALEDARRRMLASVSHELRTPLTVVRSAAFTLGRHEQDPERVERFALVDREVEHLARLIDELLTAATLRAAPVPLELAEIDLRELVEDAAARFDERADERGVVVDVHVPGRTAAVRGDTRRLAQALGNLVANAVAHAPSSSNVVVDLVAADDDRGWRCRVGNAGVPIPADVLPTVFEPFVQGPVATGAVGLGLSIASDLVAAHGGQLQVRSDERGTWFWFDLPASRRPTGAVDVVGSPRPTRVPVLAAELAT